MDGGTDGLKPRYDGYVSCHAVSCHLYGILFVSLYCHDMRLCS